MSKILDSSFRETDKELKVEADPEGFKQGEHVEMWPVDTGYSRKDGGELVKLDVREAVVRTRSRGEQQGAKEVRIHYQRWNFEIRRVSPEGKGEVNGGEDEEDGVLTLN